MLQNPGGPNVRRRSYSGRRALGKREPLTTSYISVDYYQEHGVLLQRYRGKC